MFNDGAERDARFLAFAGKLQVCHVRDGFYGVDALDPAAPSRAFIATYQDLGYLEGDTFTVLSPVNRAEQYRIRPTDDDPYRMVPVEAVDSTQLRRAIALYQTASDWHCR
mgnify:CR=1 FL=1